MSGVGGAIYTVAVDPGTQRVFMAGTNMHVVKVMDTDGTINTIAGASGVNGYSDGMGSYATLSPWVTHLFSCRYNNVDMIYLADHSNNLIRAMTTTGQITTIAGGGGGNAEGSTDAVGTNAKFNAPIGVACDSSNGDLWVVDRSNYVIRKIAYGTKEVTTVAGQLGIYGSVINGIGTNARLGQWLQHITYNPNDRCFYLADGANSVILQIAVLGKVSTFAGGGSSLDGIGTFASISGPIGLAFDPTSGNIVVGSNSNNRICVIDSATSNVVTVAGNGGSTASDGMGTYAQVTHSFDYDKQSITTLSLLERN